MMPAGILSQNIGTTSADATSRTTLSQTTIEPLSPFLPTQPVAAEAVLSQTSVAISTDLTTCRTWMLL